MNIRPLIAILNFILMLLSTSCSKQESTMDTGKVTPSSSTNTNTKSLREQLSNAHADSPKDPKPQFPPLTPAVIEAAVKQRVEKLEPWLLLTEHYSGRHSDLITPPPNHKSSSQQDVNQLVSLGFTLTQDPVYSKNFTINPPAAWKSRQIRLGQGKVGYRLGERFEFEVGAVKMGPDSMSNVAKISFTYRWFLHPEMVDFVKSFGGKDIKEIAVIEMVRNFNALTHAMPQGATLDMSWRPESGWTLEPASQ